MTSKFKIYYPNTQHDIDPRLLLDGVSVCVGYDIITVFISELFDLVPDYSDSDMVMVRIQDCGTLDELNEVTRSKLIINAEPLLATHGKGYYSIIDDCRFISGRLDNVVHIHNNRRLRNHEDMVYVDYEWNRTITRFVKQEPLYFNSITAERDMGTVHNNPHPDMYSLPSPLPAEQNNTISFLYTSHMQGPRDTISDYLHDNLVNLLREYKGHIDDPVNGIPLKYNVSNHNLVNYSILPIHNSYYINSVVSIYREQNVLTSVDQYYQLTERTWEPLIKSHFILPYGPTGMMSLLAEHYDIQLPDWINYSYDQIENDIVRWAEYQKEVRRLLALGNEQLYKYRTRDRLLLLGNRNTIAEYRDDVVDALAVWAKSKKTMMGYKLLHGLRTHKK